MTTIVVTRRFLDDYARNPANLLLLVVVPVVFVVVAADSLADAATLLGGVGGGPPIETVTAGWTAGFLAAIAMYFQVSAARETDRRLVQSGLPGRSLVAARLAAGAVLAALAVTAALLALAFSTGIDRPGRVAAGTVMFAVIYLALGAIVGATVPNPVNGTVLVMFVWILDVFFGPTLSSSDAFVTRLLPTHFVSLWTVDLPAGHGGPDELAWSLVWTVAAVATAFLVVARTSTLDRRRALPRSSSRHAASREGGSWRLQLGSGLLMALRDWRRTPVLWVLLVVVPAVFIWLSDAITPHGQTLLTLREDGRRFTEIVDPAHIHGGTMAPMAVASLAALAGIFIVLDARSADQRLAVAGQRGWVVMATRLGMVLLAALVATAASLAVVAVVFQPHQWGAYAAGNVLAATTYALIGVLLGPIFGKVSGAFMAFLLPFLDLGIGQSPMLQGEPAEWARFLPGYGSVRVLLDGALTSGFDEAGSLALSLAWIVGLTAAATLLFRRVAVAPRRSARPSPTSKPRKGAETR
jgi:hypothetical protein